MTGGEMGVESDLGAGSTFHFSLRLDPADQPPGETPPADPAVLEGMSVLVVDDNAVNREVLVETLSAWKMIPRPAGSAQEAMSILAGEHRAGRSFDVILLDVCMEEMDGFQLAERIMETPMPDGSEPLIMMLTSSDYGDQATRCRELGAAVYLVKPVRQSELLETILIALGKASAAGTGKTQAGAKTAPQRPLRILLAEDSPISRDVAVEMLQSLGHTVVAVNDGQEAVEAAGKEPFDLIFMDVQMPEKNGYEATAEIRKLEERAGRRTPIVALTAHAIKGDEQKCIDAGMDDYISKPITGDRIAEVIARVLRESPEPSPPAARPPALDVGSLLHRCMGNVQAVKRILRNFERSAGDVPDRIEQALAQSDTAAAARLAHSLKGDAATLSAEPLRAAAQAVEELAVVGAEATARTRLLELRLELNRCLDHIPQALAEAAEMT